MWDIFPWKPNEAHNGYIETYLNLGWIGLILLGLIVATGYRRAISSLRVDPEMGTLKLMFLVVGLVYNLSEAGFRMFNPLWIVFVLAITAAVRSKREKALPESYPQASWTLSPPVPSRAPAATWADL